MQCPNDVYIVAIYLRPTEWRSISKLISVEGWIPFFQPWRLATSPLKQALGLYCTTQVISLGGSIRDMGPTTNTVR